MTGLSRLVELGHQDGLKAAAAAERRRGDELIGLVEHRPAVARGADASFRVAGPERHVFEEMAAPLLRRGASARQFRRLSGPGKLPQVPRTEERPRPLEHRNLLQLLGGRQPLSPARGPLIAATACDSRLARRPSYISTGSSDGSIQRAGNAAADHHRSGRRISGEADVVGQRNANQHGGIRQHPLDAVTGAVVAAVAAEQRVVAVARQPLPSVLRRHGAGVAAVAGEAGSSVAAERLALEETAGRVGLVCTVVIVMSRQAGAERDRDRQRGESAARGRPFPPRSLSLLLDHHPLLFSMLRWSCVTNTRSHRRPTTVMSERSESGESCVRRSQWFARGKNAVEILPFAHDSIRPGALPFECEQALVMQRCLAR